MIPTDFPRPADPTFATGVRPAPQVAQMAPALAAPDRPARVVALTGLVALLSRYTARSSVVVAVAGGDRPVRGLRVDLAGAPSFGSLLDRVTAALDAAGDAAPDGVGFGPGSPPELDFSLDLHAVPGGWAAAVRFRTELYASATADRIGAQIGRVLAAAAVDPGRPVAEIALLAGDERERVTVRLARGDRVGRADRTVPEVVCAQVRRTPDATAVEYPGGRLSYLDLDRWADRLAGRFAAAGAGPGTLVAVCLDRSPELLATVLAVLKTGAAYVALDPASPAARRELILADARPVLLVTAGSVADLPDGTQANLRPAAPSDLAYVCYTSGSTGRPKGVMVEHGGVVNLLAALRQVYRFGPGTRMLQLAAPTFDSFVQEVFGPLAAGGTVVLGLSGMDVPGPELLELFDRERITTAFLPPSLLSALPDAELPALRVLAVGGEACGADLAHRWGRGRRFVNLYGPTEATVLVSASELRLPDHPPPIGRPLPGNELYVLDPQRRPVPVGVVGELYIGGRQVARGYLGRPALTARCFPPDPFQPGERLFRTGDLARWLPCGELEFVGRVDTQVQVRGYRVEPGEVEHALAGQPGVSGCAVVAQGEGADARLVAFVAGDGLVPGRLRAALANQLPAHLVPSVFVPVTALPLTPHGKVDRARLRGTAVPGRPPGLPYAPPRDELEERVAELWATVLGVRPVGRHDVFVDLGGTSLKAVQVLTRLREQLGRHASVADLYAGRTVAGLAARLAANHRPGLPPVRRTAAPDPDDGLPSLGQQRLWFLTQRYAGASSAYHVPAALRLRGPLDTEALRGALAGATRRHEALRTSFDLREEGLVRVVAPGVELPLAIVDLSDRPDELADRAAATAAEPFDLARAPLCRAALFCLGPDHHVLLVVLHHLVSDGWSLDVLDRELAAGYAERTGAPAAASRPDPRLRYADFVRWERALDQTEALASCRARLAGAPTVLPFPTDRPRPAVPRYRGRRLDRTALPDLAASLAELAGREGVTVYHVLLTALGVLLRERTGAEDLLVGSPSAGRPSTDLADVMGFFVNTVVLRVRPHGGKAFRTVLRETARAALDTFEQQYVPFEALVRDLVPERDPACPPLVQVVLAYHDRWRGNASFAGLRVEPVTVHTGTAKFDLLVEVEEVAGGLRVSAEYDRDLFEAGTVARLLDDYLALLARAVAAPQTPVCQLTPAPSTLPELFARSVDRHPDRTAVGDGRRALTYRELDRAANRVAHRLRALGAGPEVLVGVCAERTVDVVVAVLAVLKAGAGYLPLDPAHPPARHRFVLGDAGCRLVVGHDRFRAGFAEQVELVSIDGDASLAGEPDHAPVCKAEPDGVAYVIYTSGSTGAPKGVVVTHANVLRLLSVTDAGFGFVAEDSWALFHSVAFDFSVWEMWGALGYGGRLVVVPRAASRDPEAFLRLLLDERISVLNQTPSGFRGLAGAAERAGFPATSLRLVVFGGEALDPAGLDVWFDAYGDRTPRLVNMYGITETTVHVTAHQLSTKDLTGGGSPIGRPLADLRVDLLDEQLRPVPDGTVGEVYVAGPGVARGYLNRPGPTAARFLPDPHGPPGARRYRSGDLAVRRADGAFLYCGRVDEQVQLRGFRVEPREVEHGLLGHPAVRAAAVAVRPDAAGEPRLVGYAVLRPGSDVTTAQLRQALADRLPDHLVPARVVVLDALPLTANGKLDRRALPEPPGAKADPPAPVASGAQRALARIWSSVLEVDNVGVNDDFFALGGDSIRAVRVVAQARAAGLDVSVARLFDHPTVAGLARTLSVAPRPAAARPVPSTADSEALPAGVLDAYPPTAMQLGILYEYVFAGDPTLYHDLTSVRLAGPLDVDALRRALDLVTARHEALRTSFDLAHEGQPRQLVHATAQVPLHVLPAPADDPSTAVQRWWEREWTRTFDRTRAPLARCHVLRHRDGTYDVALAAHHAVLDGWSFAVLMAELLAAYDRELAGHPVDLPSLPGTRFRDFVAAEQRAVQSAETREYWRSAARPAGPGRLPPPAGRPGNAGVPVRPEVSEVLPGPLVVGVRRVAGAVRVPPKSVYLAAHLWALAALTGDEAPVSGVVTDGRLAVAGSDHLLGLFLNCLPVRCLPVGADASGRRWQDLIWHAFRTEREHLPHRRYPLAQIHADLGQAPFDVLFNYTDLSPLDALAGLRQVRAVSCWFCDRTGFGLVVEVNRRPLSRDVELAVRVHRTEVSTDAAAELAALVTWALAAIVRDPAARLGELP